MRTKALRLLVFPLIVAVAVALLAVVPAAAQEAPGEPPPCLPAETCVEPCPADAPCGDVDGDGDGFMDADELALGSDPADPSSTPEHAVFPETCGDAADNDLDGATDMADEGCTVDSDADGLPDVTDNCPYDPNADQADADGDGTGDVCDFDSDNDGFDDWTEEALGSDPHDAASTPEHSLFPETCADGADNDLDGQADAADPGCAPDGDFDLVPDDSDNCPAVYNPDQADSDGDGIGDACIDSDGDGFMDADELALGSDPADPSSTPEFIGLLEACSDGVDNDGDGQTDAEDAGCSDAGREEVLSPGPPGENDPPLVALAFTASQEPTGVQPASLPKAGGPPDGGGSGLAQPWTFALGGLLLLASGVAVFASRSGRTVGPP